MGPFANAEIIFQVFNNHLSLEGLSACLRPQNSTRNPYFLDQNRSREISTRAVTVLVSELPNIIP